MSDKQVTGSPAGLSVAVPLDVLTRALAKARIEYQHVGSDCTDKEYECWAEFEALADYLPDNAEWLAAGRAPE